MKETALLHWFAAASGWIWIAEIVISVAVFLACCRLAALSPAGRKTSFAFPAIADAPVGLCLMLGIVAQSIQALFQSQSGAGSLPTGKLFCAAVFISLYSVALIGTPQTIRRLGRKPELPVIPPSD